MRLKIVFCVALLLAATAAMAQVSQVFTPSYGAVDYAVNDLGSFYVSGSPLNKQTASSTNIGSAFQLTVSPLYSGYADSGVVLFFNGGLKLGQLQSVSAAWTGDQQPSVNVWLDANNNGQFFSFSGTKLTSLGGDTYGLGGTTPLNGSSSIGMMTGSYGPYTLSQLDSGAFSGVDANTPAALWIGIDLSNNINPSLSNTTDISSITVDTNTPVAVPEPSSLVSGLLGLMSMGGFAGFKRLKLARR